MAAYAAVVSLLNTLDLIQNHTRLSSFLDANHVQSLCQNLGILQEFIETHPHDGSGDSHDLERQITQAANTAEDLIESRMANRLLGKSTASSDTFLLDLQKAIEDLNSVKEKSMKVMDVKTIKDEPLQGSSEKPSSSSIRAPPIGDPFMVGLEDEVIQIADKLTSRQSSSRYIISIVGMGGIGKTTLAKSVYEQPHIVQYFDVQIWVTVSQEYTVRDLLLQIPILGKIVSKDSMEDNQLGEALYQSLFGKRYLVVIDDIWSTTAWDNIQHFFPEMTMIVKF